MNVRCVQVKQLYHSYDYGGKDSPGSHLAQTNQHTAERIVVEFPRGNFLPEKQLMSNSETNRSKRYSGLRPERVSRIIADTTRPGLKSTPHGAKTVNLLGHANFVDKRR